jgi:hypothetical protein
MFRARPRCNFLAAVAGVLVVSTILSTIRLFFSLRWWSYFSDVSVGESQFSPEFPRQLYNVSMTTDPMTMMTAARFRDAGVSDNGLTATNNDVSTTQTAVMSPVCFPFHDFALSKPGRRTISRIYFAHMRKASGTTLRTYLASIASHYGLDFAVGEGGRFEVPRSDEHTLYVTHFRDPYRRSLSHFEYEIRWSCQELVYNESFVPTLENAVDLISWIYENHNHQDPYVLTSSASVTNASSYKTGNTRGSNGVKNAGTVSSKVKICRRAKQSLWECSYNCYIRWMNHPDGACDGPSTLNQRHVRSSYYRANALRRFQQYDLVVDVDRLLYGSNDDGDNHNHHDRGNKNDYVRDLERWFGVDGLLSQNTPMFCLRPSRNANRRFPLIVGNDTRDLLYSRNQADYDLIRELTEPCGRGHLPPLPRTAAESAGSSRMVIFPNESRFSDFVHPSSRSRNQS